MSNLEELIEKLCPDGVEYKELSEVLTIRNGKDYKHFGEGNVPVYGSGGIMTYIDTAVYEKPSVLIPRKGSLDKLYFVQEPFWTVDTIFYTDINVDIVEPKYIFYYLQKEHLEKLNKAGGVPSLTQSVLNKVKLPVPPLEVQREIVRILDNFTFLTTELAAELAARQKQYEYYRDLLFLSLKAEYRFIPEFAKTYIGLVTTMTQHYVKEGVKLLFNSSVKENHFDFPKMVYLDNEFAEKNSSRMHKLGDIITVHTGDVGTSAIIDETLEGSLGFATIVTRIYNQEDVLPKYVSYYLNSNENKNNIYKLIKGDRNNLNLKDFNKLRVPIPSLEQQQRIVDILDRFDTLCNDISSGLPAEIEIRQKQYEYYRDKLLTFKELKKEA